MNKIFISIITLISFNSFANFPQSWINPDIQMNKMDQENEEAKFQEDFSRFTKNLDSTVDKSASNEVGKENWYLQSIKSEIGIEQVGSFGVIGAKGETAVEFVWVRTPESKKKLQEKWRNKSSSETEDNSNKETDEFSSLLLNSSSDNDVEEIAESYVNALFKSKKISKKGNLKNELTEKFIEFKKMVRNLSEVPQTSPWYVYKYQLEMFIEVSGHLTPVIGIGSGNRLRLEWYRYQKLNNEEKNMVSANFSQFISSLGEDLEALSVEKFSAKNFEMNAFKVGVGVGAKGNLFFAKGKGQVIGSLFYKRDSNWTPRPASKNNYRYLLISDDNIDGDNILREEFRSGLAKASNMGLKILNAATKGIKENNKEGKTRDFDLTVLELELELFARGVFGPVTIEGISVCELFLTKKKD